jgi:phosphoenolpyruvate---glycerone phosphotransferase subunit DhaK
MKKIINGPSEFVNDTLKGILRAHPNHLRAISDDFKAIVRADSPVRGKVAIATGGGSGHLPLFIGYIGEGLVNGVAVGNVFSSPSPSQILAVTNSINGGAGVLYLYGNYQGDALSFNSAAEMAELEDINVETVLVTDDVASAPRDKRDSRRGIAGLFFAYKIAGALANEGADLYTVKTMAEKTVVNTCSMGVALTSCIVPEAGHPGFTIGEDEMEIGLGIHGERGVRRGKIQSADETTEILMKTILNDLPFESGNEVAVLVNGLGATPKEELYIVFNKVAKILDELKIKIYRNYIGEYCTSMEMAGVSISLLRLDPKMKMLLDAPAQSPFFSLM